VLISLFEIVGVNNLLRVQKQQFYEKELSESIDELSESIDELSESIDERYLF
jgi:hypothetical protein